MPVPEPVSLTPRQSQILRMIALGKVGKEIAWELRVSTKTIEYHRQQIMDKLNCHGIANLTRYAIGKGLI